MSDQSRGVAVKAGLLAGLVFFLLLPQASCGNLSFSGLDLIQDENLRSGLKFPLLCIVGGAAVGFFLSVDLGGIGGAAALFGYSLLFTKLKDDSQIGRMVKIEPGAVLGIICFIVSVLLSFESKNLFGRRSEEDQKK